MRHRVLTHFVSVLVTGLIILVSGNADAWFPHGGWVLPGASADLDFADSLYYPDPVVTNSISTTRASTGYAQWADGHLSLFAANAPRITDQGLLVEEARTNLALQSQAFDTASWGPGNAGVGALPVVTADFSTAPDGTLTADRVVFSLSGGTAGTDQSQITGAAATVTNGAAYTQSIWAKTNNGATIVIQFLNAQLGGTNAITVTPAWQRFTLTTTAASTLANIQLRLRGAQTPTNSNTADLSLWGAQLELGSFSTSYIPTTTVAVTRAADNITLASAAATAALNSASMFTQSNATNASTTGRFVHFSGGAFMKVLSSSQVQINNNSAQSTLATLGSGTTSGPLKVAFGYDASSITAIANGGSLGTQPNAWAGTGTVYVGSNNGASAINGYLQRLAFSAAKGQFDGRTQ